MLINLKDLSKIMKRREIIDKVDHKNLNIDVPFLEGIITTENVTMKFWDVLEDKINSLENTECSLYKIRVYETPRNFVEYYVVKSKSDLLIICGERSGDLHGSIIVKRLLSENPKLKIHCWGGDLMKKSGAIVLEDYKNYSTMGFVEEVFRLSFF